jgi:hypothetical protein
MNRIALLATLMTFSLAAYGADNLHLNPRLDYTSDSHDGPLITGDHMEGGPAAGKPNYVIFYGEACFNSKHQAKRTVELYQRYQGRVNFVVVDLDQHHSKEQDELVKRYYKGPHVVVLDAKGKALYNQSGEVEANTISDIFDQALR